MKRRHQCAERGYPTVHGRTQRCTEGPNGARGIPTHRCKRDTYPPVQGEHIPPWCREGIYHHGAGRRDTTLWCREEDTTLCTPCIYHPGIHHRIYTILPGTPSTLPVCASAPAHAEVPDGNSLGSNLRLITRIRRIEVSRLLKV